MKSIFILLIFSCEGAEMSKDSADNNQDSTMQSLKIATGAEQTDLYLPLLSDKKVGVVGNQTSVIGGVHLVDSLLSNGVEVVKVFSPEHGFRGDADAGELVSNGRDAKTGLPIVSLYGKNKKPYDSQLKGLDVVIFDIQDVGVRFYTYISTLHYVMEACAENGIPLVVLDRPNPNGHYVDGPILDTANYRSFVGMHPVPIVHGMTIGEYAKMINGEGWLKQKVVCDLTVITCVNYKHTDAWSLAIPPSPNLRSDYAISLYPSLCLLEATAVTVGRGTDGPFERYGHPNFPDTLPFSFVPEPNFGAKKPKLEGQKCYGFNLATDESNLHMTQLNLSYLQSAYQYMNGNLFVGKSKQMFFLLCGNDAILKQLQQGLSESEIRETWQDGLSAYHEIRNKYVLYPLN